MTARLRQYLGDAVYVAVEDGSLKLTTEDGIRVISTIYLDETVLEALVVYLREKLGMKL